MQLIDKDLLSMQEVRELVEAAKEAQQELARMDQAQVDRIVRAIADAGVRNARRLAQMANEDTGFGIVDDKVIKNIFASRGVYEHIKDMKTIGEISRDDAKRLRTIAVPVGVIAGLIPSTNPTSTALYKAEIAIKAGNAIVFSPHPTALRCILETVKVIRQAVAEAGGNENLVSCITIPTMEATDNLMRHRDVAMILATGGSAVAAIHFMKNYGCKHIKLMNILAAPEGIKAVREAHPDVDIYVAGVDEKLNDHGYIVPGLGDAGDRIFGTK